LETTDTFGKDVKGGAGMGSKHRETRNLNPGPGQYETFAHKSIRPTSSYGKIGTTKRNDIWGTDLKKKEGMPGPGHHTKSYSSFANTKTNTFGLTTGRQ